MSVEAVSPVDHKSTLDLSLLNFQYLSPKEIKSQFRINGRPVRSTRQIGDEYLSGKVYQTATQGEWFVIPPAVDARVPFSDNATNTKAIRDAMLGRQKYERPAYDDLLVHERNIRFFAANWSKLFPLFYDTYFGDMRRVAGFSEVDLNDLKLPVNEVVSATASKSCGRIDFLGFGPDGGAVMIDFSKSTSGKNIQLQKQRVGLEKLVAQGVPHITAFIGVYKSVQGCSVVDIRPAMVVINGGSSSETKTPEETVVFRVKKNGKIRFV